MWPNPQFSGDLVTFTEEILNRRLHFLCSVSVFFGIIQTLRNAVFDENLTLPHSLVESAKCPLPLLRNEIFDIPSPPPVDWKYRQ